MSGSSADSVIQQLAQTLAARSRLETPALAAAGSHGGPPPAGSPATATSASLLASVAAAQQLVSAAAAQQASAQQAVQQFASNSAAQHAAHHVVQQLASASAAQQLAQQVAQQLGLAPAAQQLPVAAAAPAVGSRAEPSGPSSEKSAIEEVPKCHLHRRPNKACKFCKAHVVFQDLRNKEADQKRNAAIEKLKEGTGTKSGAPLKQDDKVPLPNLPNFPAELKERILNTRFYKTTSIDQEVPEVKETLYACESCEPDHNSVDATPSVFFCCVYRMLTIKLTEGQLQGLLNNRSLMVRCAGFLYVRLGVHTDRYWDLLSEALLDHEEFVPFPRRGGERMTDGQYVEQLLTMDKYCEFKLPRIEAAQRRIINEKLVLYDQFRKRYLAHMEDLGHLRDPDDKIPVEVCNAEGNWRPAETVGPPTPGRRRVAVPVRFPDGTDQNVSLGMLICPGKKRSASSRGQDLASSRGRSNEELLEEWRVKQRGAAVASGKDYCKTSGRHMVHAGGMVFMGGGKRSKEKDSSDSEDERRAKEAKKSAEKSREHELKMATIMEKYCARATQAKGQSGDAVDGPDRLRLG